MLDFLQATGRVSPRKLRLLACACSRRAWSSIDNLGSAAIETAERYADGRADSGELRFARLACKGAGGQAAWYAAATDPFIAARNAGLSALSGTTNAEGELSDQADLLRDIFGNPFHQPPA